MSKETTTQVVSSFSVFGLLGAILVILKALGKITLAWGWVLAPFWIPALFGIGALVTILCLVIVAAIATALID